MIPRSRKMLLRTHFLCLVCASPLAATSSDQHIVPLQEFTVAEGLTATLWAQSPQLNNPTNMDIDAQGRIWVTEGVNYRRHMTRNPEGDRVVVLEDTDGDGHADQSHVFVQEPGMIAPLGIAVIDNRIYVSCAPSLIVYTDVDRDLKFDPAVDKRQVLLTGFNGANHDHSLHSVTMGPDGRLYFSQGNSGALFVDNSGQTFRIGSAYSPQRSGATDMFAWETPDIAGMKSDDGHVYVGGFTMRMSPEGKDAEVIGYGYRNSYEQTVNSFGDIFLNDNDDPPACRTSFLIEYGSFGFYSTDGQRTWTADRRPGQTTANAEWRQEDPHTIPAGDVYGGGAPTGIVFYEGDALGPKWRGVLLNAEAARNTIMGYFPRPEGAGYALENFDFFTSNSEKEFAGIDADRGRMGEEIKTFFRPSDVAVGPDGAIYVADWFDPRVGGHQDLDDSLSGAIYRIAPANFVSRPPQFDPATLEGQLIALQSPAINVRAIGFAGLVARGDAATEAVSALLKHENPYVRARAVWVLAQLGPQGLRRVQAVAAGADAALRVTAYRAMRQVTSDLPALAQHFASDPSVAVRREVAVSLRDVPTASSVPILLTLAQSYPGSDRSYLAAWGIGCTGKEAEIFAALIAQAPDTNPAKWPTAFADLVWRLVTPESAAALARRAKASALPATERMRAITALGFLPTKEAADALLDLAESPESEIQRAAFWWIINFKDTRWAGLALDAELKRRGLYDPAKTVVTPSVVPRQREEDVIPVEAVLALTGDPTMGAAKIRACFLCHQLGEEGNDYGPNLTGFAQRQTPEVLITAIVAPSEDVSHGYEGSEIELKNGDLIHGRLLAQADPLVIQTMGGTIQLVPDDRVKKVNRYRRSLMLSADQLGYGAQDVADIVSYLRSLTAK